MSSRTSYSKLRDYIDSLPTQDTPQLFGMDQNADKAFLERQALELTEGILSVQPRLTLAAGGPGGVSSNDSIVLGMAADMLASIPKKVSESPQDDLTVVVNVNVITLTLADIVKIGTGQDYSMLKKKAKDLKKDKG